MDSIMFILGAGASVDSGMTTYRGKDGLYTDTNLEELLHIRTLRKEPDVIWKFMEDFYHNTKKATFGETYQIIRKLIQLYPQSFIITQNVDSIIKEKEMDVPIVELHGSVHKMKCLECNLVQGIDFNRLCTRCNSLCRPNITLFGEHLDDRVVQSIWMLIKARKPKYIMIIGTTLQFPYLRTIISHTRTEKKHRIHVNPDINYQTVVKKGEVFINDVLTYDILMRIL